MHSRKDGANFLDSDGNIIPPLPAEVIKDLFGWLSINTNLPYKQKGKTKSSKSNEDVSEIESEDDEEKEAEEEVEEQDEEKRKEKQTIFAENKVTISHSCMQGYKSALVWYYAEKEVIMDKTLNQWCDSFVDGYKKTVASKKSRGVMSATEGKSPLSFSGYLFLVIIMIISVVTKYC